MEEAIEILTYNYENINFVAKLVELGFTYPLELHCSYSTDQIMAAFGYFNGIINYKFNRTLGENNDTKGTNVDRKCYYFKCV